MRLARSRVAPEVHAAHLVVLAGLPYVAHELAGNRDRTSAGFGWIERVECRVAVFGSIGAGLRDHLEDVGLTLSAAGNAIPRRRVRTHHGQVRDRSMAIQAYREAFLKRRLRRLRSRCV